MDEAGQALLLQGPDGKLDGQRGDSSKRDGAGQRRRRQWLLQPEVGPLPADRTLFLPYFHMSFAYFLGLLVVSNAIGAFSALLGGISDRVGRANLTILGVLIVGLIQLFVIPHTNTSLELAIAWCRRVMISII